MGINLSCGPAAATLEIPSRSGATVVAGLELSRLRQEYPQERKREQAMSSL
jgi:hypothetical protein